LLSRALAGTAELAAVSTTALAVAAEELGGWGLRLAAMGPKERTAPQEDSAAGAEAVADSRGSPDEFCLPSTRSKA